MERLKKDDMVERKIQIVFVDVNEFYDENDKLNTERLRFRVKEINAKRRRSRFNSTNIFLKIIFFCNPCLGLFGSLRFGVIIDLSFAFKKHMFFVCLNPFQNPAWISRIDLVLVFANQNFPLVFNPILESQVIMCGFFFDNCHLVMSPFEVQFAYK